MSDSTGWLKVRERMEEVANVLALRSGQEDAAFVRHAVAALNAAEHLNNYLTSEEWTVALGDMSYDGRKPSVPETLRADLDVELEHLIDMSGYTRNAQEANPG